MSLRCIAVALHGPADHDVGVVHGAARRLPLRQAPRAAPLVEDARGEAGADQQSATERREHRHQDPLLPPTAVSLATPTSAIKVAAPEGQRGGAAGNLHLLVVVRHFRHEELPGSHRAKSVAQAQLPVREVRVLHVERPWVQGAAVDLLRAAVHLEVDAAQGDAVVLELRADVAGDGAELVHIGVRLDSDQAVPSQRHHADSHGASAARHVAREAP
mmetsp:Transcript_104186/g.291867  ORF Transcript_104186/g.291867 Transcript_104186/m.291867 type:complete len:216 (+) Transcript_104186:208-855(+)